MRKTSALIAHSTFVSLVFVVLSSLVTTANGQIDCGVGNCTQGIFFVRVVFLILVLPKENSFKYFTFFCLVLFRNSSVLLRFCARQMLFG